MTNNRPKLKNIYIPLLLSAVLIFILLLNTFPIKDDSIPGLVLASKNSESKTNHAPSDPNKQASRPEHKHLAFNQYNKERRKMVAWQIQARRILNKKVLTALRTVPRHAFVRKTDLRRAYSDQPLPIGLGQTISQPYIVAYMTEKLKLTPDSNVLEIGTGSGYQAAVCAEIAKEVYTIEIIPQLAQSARKRLKNLGYKNVTTKAADGYFGWEDKAPFDRIIVTAVAGFVPPPLIKQLKPGGRMILPVGSPFGAQTLMLITKDTKGVIRSKSLLPVRFVPMLGQITKDQQPAKK